MLANARAAVVPVVVIVVLVVVKKKITSSSRSSSSSKTITNCMYPLEELPESPEETLSLYVG